MPAEIMKQIVAAARVLTSEEKTELIRELETQLKADTGPAKPPFRSLLGVLADLGPAPSEEEIDEARREAWANYPRDTF